MTLPLEQMTPHEIKQRMDLIGKSDPAPQSA